MRASAAAAAAASASRALSLSSRPARRRDLVRRLPIQQVSLPWISSSGCALEAPSCEIRDALAMDGRAAHSDASAGARWTDWFPRADYADLYSDGVPPLVCPELDRPTRYLLRLLDDSLLGVRRGVDKATTSRCNRALEMLADKSVGGRALIGRAQRADEILTRMERHLQRGKAHSQAAANAEGVPGLPLPLHLPLPDKRTYRLVLRMFGSTAGPASVAERAEQIVVGMEEYASVRGDPLLRPDVTDWNQAVAAWANSSDTDRAYRAAAVLVRIREQQRSEQAKLGSGIVPNASSYGHAMRACAAAAQDTERRRRDALRVGMGIWKDVDRQRRAAQSGMSREEGEEGGRDQTVTTVTSSHFYSFLLHVLSFMPPDTAERDDAVERAFSNCQQDGQVNAHVLLSLREASSDQIYLNLLGERLVEHFEKGGPSVLALKIPDGWKRNAKVDNEWGW